MDFLRDLYYELRTYDWYWSLPEWLREPPGLYVAAVLLALLPVVLLGWGMRGRRPREVYRGDRRRELARQARERLRERDYLGAGQDFETLGKHRAALRAYRRGECHEELVDLLARRGKTEEAKAAARDAGLWESYAQICESGGRARRSRGGLREGWAGLSRCRLL